MGAMDPKAGLGNPYGTTGNVAQNDDTANMIAVASAHYSVLKDWVIDSTATCTADTANDKDAFLHAVICQLKAAGVWNIVLTPNYNADHRNHFHVDLTKGSDFIKRAHEGLPLDD